MSQFEFAAPARWVWCDQAVRPFHNVVSFRRVIDRPPGASAADFQITADSRYELYVDGEWIGHGPPRSWPEPWPVDRYELRGLEGRDRIVVAVLVEHHGRGTMQYLHRPAGLIAQVGWADADGRSEAPPVVTDASWRCAVHEGYIWPVPRIALQQSWEEQYDARRAPGAGDATGVGAACTEPGFDDAAWPAAAVVAQAPHESFESRDIPMLTREVVEPNYVNVQAVTTAPYTFTIDPQPLFNPDDRASNHSIGRVLVATHIYSNRDQPVQLSQPGDGSTRWKLNGRPLAFEDHSLLATDSGVAHAELKRGWNTLLGRLSEESHLWRVVVNLWAAQGLRFAARPEQGQPPATHAGLHGAWLLLGPFGGYADPRARNDRVEARYTEALRIDPAATGERFQAIWESGTVDADALVAPLAQVIPGDCLPPVNVFAVCASERPVAGAAPRIEGAAAIGRDNADWAVIHPVAAAAGPSCDARVLLDFGREIVGFTEFEVDAAAGTVLDFHGFEFIQPDGRINLAEGMNNTFRYTCRAGVQRYRSFLRRGFRYGWLTVRGTDRSVRIRYVRALLSTYPVSGLGDFACSDPMLDAIWRVGVHSVRVCAEDTYTDCPTYEQVHWVGDARNEALVDLVVNGDPRLSEHCWVQAARSLDRSAIVESHVPSAWENVLPAWSFLWMRWAQEHYQLTGDRGFAERALPWLDRNVQGVRDHLGARGLFEYPGWNMFDWAEMDTPSRGIVTHQNCLAVLGLRQAAELAGSVGDAGRADAWNALADALGAAINEHLWDARSQAYLDAIHADGRPSEVLSQQTQTAALIAGVARGTRGARCRSIIDEPPDGFVHAGSPFFMFFLLEVLEREGDFSRMIDTIADYWGRQIQAGATTFWEMYLTPQSGGRGRFTAAHRLTRSHCHGWSAAPVYFLTRHALGVQALEPGYARVLIAPRPHHLRWARGTVPTPRGPVSCRWWTRGESMRLELSLPPGVPAQVRIPRPGVVTCHAGQIDAQQQDADGWTLTTAGPTLHVAVSPAGGAGSA